MLDKHSEKWQDRLALCMAYLVKKGKKTAINTVICVSNQKYTGS